MNLGGNLNNGGEAKKEFAPFIDGIYAAKVLRVTPGKQSKSSDMIYTEVEFVITEGDFSKRRVWERLAESNASSKALEVGRSRLQKLLQATVGSEAASQIFEGQKELGAIVERPVSLELATKGKFTNIKKFMAV